MSHHLPIRMEASDDANLKIWDGLVGEDASSFFHYIGPFIGQKNDGAETRIQMKLLSRLIRIVGDYLGAMLSRDLSVQLVIQLGNITLEVDQNNPDGSIASESSQVKSSSCTVSSSGRRGSRPVSRKL